VIVTGFSSSREVRQAIFRFTPVAGAQLQTTELTLPVDAAFSRWYQDPASAVFGSQFALSQSFTSSDAASIASVTVILVNQQGQSAPVSAQLQ
jgi:hypothetical protein